MARREEEVEEPLRREGGMDIGVPESRSSGLTRGLGATGELDRCWEIARELMSGSNGDGEVDGELGSGRDSAETVSVRGNQGHGGGGIAETAFSIC